MFIPDSSGGYNTGEWNVWLASVNFKSLASIYDLFDKQHFKNMNIKHYFKKFLRDKLPIIIIKVMPGH